MEKLLSLIDSKKKEFFEFEKNMNFLNTQRVSNFKNVF